MKKILALLILIPSISNAYNLIFNPFTGKLDYVGISTTSLAVNAILNQSTLQSGATFYVSSGTVVNALNLYGDFKINAAGTDFVSYSTTTAKLRLINGATTLATSLPLLLWNNNSIVGRFTGIGFAVGASSTPLAYWYLDNQNNRLTMADGSGNVACYFDTLTLNLVCNYGITASTGTFGDASSTSFGNNSYVVINSSGSSQNLTLNVNGIPSGGLQNKVGAFTINDTIATNSPAPLEVIYDSTTDPQNGTGLFEIWEDNINHNDPLFWIHNASNQSNPYMRVDDAAPDSELVCTSTDNAHGLGKWEPASIAFQGVDLQINDRAYDNNGFETLAYWHPLHLAATDTLMPGLYINPQNSAANVAVVPSSDTAGVTFFTLNSHTVGLTGPKNNTASYTFGLPDTVGAAGDVLYNSGNRGGNFNVRQMKWTAAGSTGYTLMYQAAAAPIWTNTVTSSATFTAGIQTSTVTLNSVTFTTLGSAATNGSSQYCSDCTVTTPATCTTNLLASCVCAASGTGAFARRINGTWYCN